MVHTILRRAYQKDVFTTSRKPMRSTKTSFYIIACLLLCIASIAPLVTRGHAAPAAPDKLTNEQFWSLSKEWSEEDGVFRSDNLLSNETSFQYIIPPLLKTAKLGRVYMGVGPEQNFTYIAALKPDQKSV